MKKTMSVLLFILVGMLLFNIIQNVFVEKSSYAKWQNWKEQENVDVLILGNSHADNALIPSNMEEAFYEAYGENVSVFNYSIFGMRMEQMYFFAKELLETQTPDVIIVETFAFCPLEDEYREILARRAFDVFPLSKNKIEAINYCVLEDHWSYYIPFIKYHSRWKELSSNDVSLLHDRELWAAAGKTMNTEPHVMMDIGDGFFYQDMSKVTEVRPLTPTQEECLENFILLLKEKDIDLLFVGVPYKTQMGLDSIEMVKVNNYLQKKYVDNDKIRMLDMNLMWQELQFNYWDLYNDGHVNEAGAIKVTNCLIEYIKEYYDIAEMIG